MKNIDVANLQQRDLNNIILVILLSVLLFTWYIGEPAVSNDIREAFCCSNHSKLPGA